MASRNEPHRSRCSPPNRSQQSSLDESCERMDTSTGSQQGLPQLGPFSDLPEVTSPSPSWVSPEVESFVKEIVSDVDDVDVLEDQKLQPEVGPVPLGDIGDSSIFETESSHDHL
ncbi:hypothetical protein MRX96_016552 [Rhipicephalus microplus]